jgi:hypothetical protein
LRAKARIHYLVTHFKNNPAKDFWGNAKLKCQFPSSLFLKIREDGLLLLPFKLNRSENFTANNTFFDIEKRIKGIGYAIDRPHTAFL